MKKKIIITLLSILISAFSIQHVYASNETDLLEADIKRATVEWIIDGDTIIVLLEDGQRPHIRLIGFDAPEDTTVVDPFGPEATAYLRNFLPIGSEVWLTREGNNASFNRLRRHVWLAYPENWSDDPMSYSDSIRQHSLAARMLAAGYGETLPRFTPIFAELFLEIEQEARDARRGMWITLESDLPDLDDLETLTPELDPVLPELDDSETLAPESDPVLPELDDLETLTPELDPIIPELDDLETLTPELDPISLIEVDDNSDDGKEKPSLTGVSLPETGSSPSNTMNVGLVVIMAGFSLTWLKKSKFEKTKCS